MRVFLLLALPLLGWAPLQTGSGESPAWKASLEAAEKARHAHHFKTEQRHLETALRLAQQAGAPPSEIGDILDRLGTAYYFQKKDRKAEETLVRSLILKEDALGEGQPSVAVTLEHLAALADQRGFKKKAEEYRLEALRIREEALGVDHPDLAETLILLGVTREMAGRFEEAEAYFQRALSIRERALGEEHPLIAETLALLIALYDETGRQEEAREVEARSWAIWAKEAPPPDAPPQR
jgi:tetratricopeptide (TPR) repeat protein